MNLKELLDARNQALSEARQYVDKKEATPEDEAAYQKALEEFRRLDRLVTDEKAFAKAESEAAEARAELEDIVHPKELRKADDQRVNDWKALFNGEKRSVFIPFSHTETNLVSHKRSQRTTGDIIKSDSGAGAYGSYTIPTTIWNQILYHQEAASGIMATNATIVRTATGESMTFPTHLTDMTSAITADGTASTQTIPVASRQSVDVYRIDGHVSVSKEFIEDSAIDAISWVQNSAARSMAYYTAYYAAYGSGSSQPYGLNYTTELTSAGKTAASASTFTADEALDLYLSLYPGYRARGEWVASSTAYAVILKWKDDEGRYLVTNPTAAEPATLLGKPLREDANFQAIASASCPLVFGDFSTFYMRYARGVEFSRDDSFAFTSFESTFRYAVWFGSNLIDRTGSIKHLLMAT